MSDFRDLVSDLVACALIEGNEPKSQSAAAATKRLKQEVLDAFERLSAVGKSRRCAELHFALEEWRDAGAPTKDVVDAVANLIQDGFDTYLELETARTEI